MIAVTLRTIGPIRGYGFTIGCGNPFLLLFPLLTVPRFDSFVCSLFRRVTQHEVVNSVFSLYSRGRGSIRYKLQITNYDDDERYDCNC
jgi:hypothetical protein